MFYEPSTLASLAALLATALRKEYGIDPGPIYLEAGISLDPPESPQLRYPLSDMRVLWQLAREASGDDAIGLKTGQYAKPTQFYAFGYSWLASSTLLGCLQRLVRYHQLLSTASEEYDLRETNDGYALSALFPEKSKAPSREGIDCGMTALLSLCDVVAEKEIRPVRVDLICAPTVHPAAYRTALRAPVTFNAKVGAIYFDKKTIEARLPGSAPDIAKATDKIAERYIETLDPHKVASHVRRLLVHLLPSGKTDRNIVAERLNRSASTLRRQLHAEGFRYRDVLGSTRQSLAEEYLSNGEHSHTEIAYLLGFSDQSNFSRAFKRWTSRSPREHQEEMRKD